MSKLQFKVGDLVQLDAGSFLLTTNETLKFNKTYKVAQVKNHAKFCSYVKLENSKSIYPATCFKKVA
jgi:hypothetical protein